MNRAEQLLTTGEAAEQVGVSRQTIWQWAISNRYHGLAVKIGGRWYIKAWILEKVLQNAK